MTTSIAKTLRAKAHQAYLAYFEAVHIRATFAAEEGVVHDKDKAKKACTKAYKSYLKARSAEDTHLLSLGMEHV